MGSQVTKRSLTVIAGYLMLAALLSGWFTLMAYDHGVDVDDGSKLTALSFLKYMGEYGVILMVVGLPALIMGMAGGWWAAMAHRKDELERIASGDQPEANL